MGRVSPGRRLEIVVPGSGEAGVGFSGACIRPGDRSTARQQADDASQQRIRGNTEHLRPTTPRQQTGLRRQPYPIGRLIPHPLHLTAQHSVLMTKHQQLNVLGHLTTRDDRHRRKNEPRDHVNQRESHPARLPGSTTLRSETPQVNTRPYSRAAQVRRGRSTKKTPRGRTRGIGVSRTGVPRSGSGRSGSCPAQPGWTRRTGRRAPRHGPAVR